MDKEDRRYYRIATLHRVFALSSALLLASIIWLVADDWAAEWKEWQRRFISLEETEEGGEVQPGIKRTPEHTNKQSGHGLKSPSPLSKNIAAYLRDLPLLDFFNPSLKLDQIVLKEFTFDLKFARASRVDRCVSCHIPVMNPKYESGVLPLKSHPKKELFLSFDSPHPINSFGCSVCHQGRDRGTSFNSSAHFPGTRKTELEWRKKYRWEPLNSWRYPMLPLRYIESSCLPCHEKGRSLRGATKLSEGRRLIRRLGCEGCHIIPMTDEFKKPGPSLRKISSKLDRGWVRSWILNPAASISHAKMPVFFPARGGLHREESLKRVDAIVEFLFYQSEEYQPRRPPVSGNVERGFKLFTSIGCTACHPVPGKEDSHNTKEYKSLSNLSAKVTEEWLFSWLKAPGKFSPNTPMPDFRLSDMEAADIAKYLLADHNNSLNPGFSKGERDGNIDGETPPKRVIELGKKLVSRYGCFGCHEIKGFENTPPVGPDLSNVGLKPVRNFDFGVLRGEIERSRHSWLYKKIENPRVFSGKVEGGKEALIMPVYRLSGDEIESIVTFLLGLTGESVPEPRKRELTEEERIVEKAFKIFEERRCLACHTLNGEGGMEESGDGADRRSAHLLPPPLNGEGGMVRPQWLFNFLKNPTSIRPWLETRMPDFNLSDKEVETLVTFFSINDGRETVFDDTQPSPVSDDEVRVGREIFTLLKCNSCHMTEELKSIPEGEIGPDLTLAKNRLREAWIKRWLEEPQKIKRGTRMPTNWIKVTRRGKTRYTLPPSLKKILKGDVKKQISSVTAYLLSL